MNNSLYGNFRQIRFTEVWSTAESFLADYKASGLAPTNNKISDDSAKVLYALLYSRYGNSTLASSDTTQFEYQVFSLIYSYGPTWEKRIDIQNKVRSLTDSEVTAGVKMINNHAYNPSTDPSAGTTTELSYINEQNVNTAVRSKLTGYASLIDLLDTDVTEEFLGKFKKLFLQIVMPERPLWYIEKTEEGDEDDD